MNLIFFRIRMSLATNVKEKQLLEAALKMNQPLATVYIMKEDLRQFWSQPSYVSAALFLNDWIKKAIILVLKCSQNLLLLWERVIKVCWLIMIIHFQLDC